jgi:hypothetical protein
MYTAYILTVYHRSRLTALPLSPVHHHHRHRHRHHHQPPPPRPPMRHSHHRHPILTLSVLSYISYSPTVATTTPSPGCPSSISSHLASLGSHTCPPAHNHNQTASPPLLSSSPLRNYNQQYSFHSPSPAASPLHRRHRQPVIHLIIIHLQERARAFIPSVLLSTLPSLAPFRPSRSFFLFSPEPRARSLSRPRPHPLRPLQTQFESISETAPPLISSILRGISILPVLVVSPPLPFPTSLPGNPPVFHTTTKPPPNDYRYDQVTRLFLLSVLSPASSVCSSRSSLTSKSSKSPTLAPLLSRPGYTSLPASLRPSTSTLFSSLVPHSPSTITLPIHRARDLDGLD